MTGPDLLIVDDCQLYRNRLAPTGCTPRCRQPVVIDDQTFAVSASIGITVVRADDPRNASQLLRDADRAMYQAKTAGQGQSRYIADDLRRRGA